MKLKDCNDCKNINITEKRQRSLKRNDINHFCKKYKQRLWHLRDSFHIEPCTQCIADEFVKLDEEIHEEALKEAFKYEY